MRKRREAQSSALSFMDCICCGFGAVLLLFILTAKARISNSQEEASQSLEAFETLQAAINATEAKQKALDKEIESLDPQPEANASSVADLAAKKERLAKEIEDQAQALSALETQAEPTEQTRFLDRPSADQSYLSGLRLRGPKAVILVESSGSMLAYDAKTALELIQNGTTSTSKKWQRAKSALRAVIAAIPKGTDIAVFAMAAETRALSGSEQNPYIDPYDNNALLALLEGLDKLEAKGGADLAEGMRTVSQLKNRPSSLLLIGDGLPTAPAPNNGSLSESERVDLFNKAQRVRINFPFNAILFPFDGDPSAAGLFWQLSSRTNGITLIPSNDWPVL